MGDADEDTEFTLPLEEFQSAQIEMFKSRPTGSWILS
jgi:hypothetical protein